MEAIELISKYHTTEIVINQAVNNFVGSLGMDKWTLHVKKCCAAVVDRLIAHGYSVSMTEYGMAVEKY